MSILSVRKSDKSFNFRLGAAYRPTTEVKKMLSPKVFIPRTFSEEDTARLRKFLPNAILVRRGHKLV